MPRRNRNASRNRGKGVSHRAKINLSQITSCQQKNNYSSEQAAQKVAEIQMLANMNLELDVYHCPICHNWHLTRSK